MPVGLTHEQMARLESMSQDQREAYFRTPQGRAERGGWQQTIERDPEAARAARPDELQFQGITDPSGQLQSQYKYTAQTLDPNSMEAFQAMKGRALTQGPTQWAKLMQDQQRLEQKGLADRAATQAASGAADARAAMASRGGLSTGSRERMAMNQQRGLLGARQDVARQGAQQRGQILTQDEQQKMNMLGQVSGQEIGMGQFNVGAKNQESMQNIQTQLANKAAQDQFAQNQYQNRMKEWASNREAQAAEERVRNRDRGMFGASWVCSRVHTVSPISIEDWGTLFKLREFLIATQPKAAQAYLREFGPLIQRMDEQGVNWNTYRPIIDETIALIKTDIVAAYNFYVNSILDLAEKFWPDCPHDIPALRATTVNHAKTA